MTADIAEFLTAPTCSAPSCERGGKLTRGMCARCYRAWRVSTPVELRGPSPRASRDFWDFVEKTHEHGCWLWNGPRDVKGYGRWAGGGVKDVASRHSWQLAHGDIPDGLWVLHYCDMPPCVNPRHLYLGTIEENTIDAVTRGRNYVPPRIEQCGSGHEVSGDNLRIVPRADGNVTHICRKCDNARSRERQRVIRAGRVKRSPPPGRLSTVEVIERYDIRKSTLFSWQRAGLLASIVVNREAWWSPEEIATALQSRRPEKAAA